LLQVAVGFAFATTVTVTSPLPSPVNAPDTLSVSLSTLLVVVTGVEFLKWTLAAKTTPAVILSAIAEINTGVLIMCFI
jgi:hypothetical protein